MPLQSSHPRKKSAGSPRHATASFQSTPDATINSSGHGHIELCPSPTARPPYHVMEEFQEAEILWPSSNDHRDNDNGDDIRRTGTTTLPPVRPKPASQELSAPIEISRRKRRCRPWAASEHATFDQETGGGGDGEEDGSTDDAKQRSAKGLTIVVPPHVLLARRRLLGGRTAAYSMCAGKGRTLKGRDLRDVRNLVLKMTGFIEK
uniref:Uncharacterized protein n=1 Tax=Setaria viridis TaxID=4556 RepID=A0A4U6VP00_SETVI|nr:uncharacterized protein LOC117847613 [Setaria viridis]TKW26217.1 hypothetical protein SEVIR_3G172500v2 [Setaria viridis]